MQTLRATAVVLPFLALAALVALISAVIGAGA
jgi:hypothetical protein